MKIGEKIKQIRLSMKKSLREFDTITGVSYGYLGLLERDNSGHGDGKHPSPTIEVLQQICNRSGYDFRTFLEETGYLSPTTEQIKKAQPVVVEPEITEIQKLYNAMNDAQRAMLVGYAQGVLTANGIDVDELLA